MLDGTKHTDAGTQFTVLGMDRDFAITWQKEGADTPGTSTPLEATGLLDAQIDGAGVHTKVQLAVPASAPNLTLSKSGCPRVRR